VPGKSLAGYPDGTGRRVSKPRTEAYKADPVAASVLVEEGLSSMVRAGWVVCAPRSVCGPFRPGEGFA
jgi:hypothetical protein